MKFLRFSDSFASKIVLVFLFVILFPSIILSLTINMQSTYVVKKNVRVNTFQLAKQTADSLSFIFKSGNDISDYIFSNPDIQNAVININENVGEEQPEIFQDMNNILSQIVYSNSFIENVYVWKDTESDWPGSMFSPYMYHPSMYKLIRIRASDQEWIKEAKQKDGGLFYKLALKCKMSAYPISRIAPNS